MDPLKQRRLRETWRQRRIQAIQDEQERLEQSMTAAREMAQRLRERWGAQQVVLFGSVARRAASGGRLKSISDIDLAVTGINPADFFFMHADVERLSPVPVDIVLLEDCSEQLRAIIERDGIPM